MRNSIQFNSIQFNSIQFNSITKVVVLTLLIFSTNSLSAGSWSYPNGNQTKIADLVTLASYPYKVHNYYSDNDLRYTIQASSGLYIQFAVEIEAVIPTLYSYTTFQGIVSNTYQNTGTTVNIGYMTNQYGILNVDLGVKLSMTDNEANCNEYKIRYRLTCVNGYPQFSSDWAEIKIIKQEHLSPVLTLAQKQNVDAVLQTPDLMIKDHRLDGGFEPFSSNVWNYDYREITQCKDFFNTPGTTLDVFENPMYSINNPPRANTFIVKVRNRSCVSTPPAELHAYWTIARLWEPWASDWKNHNRYISESDGNSLFDKDGIERPLGNHMTLTDKYDYSSPEKAISIPTVPGAGSEDVFIEWIVPNPDWYLGTSTLPIQVKSTGEPVICLLARINEPWRTDNGFYLNPNTFTTKTNIVDYVSANNNAATRNTFILNSKNGYKNTPSNQNPRSRVGVIAINNPENQPNINIGLLRDLLPNDDGYNFTSHARVTLYLDSLIWNRWINGGMLGNNYTVIDNQIIQITNSNFASLNNINLEDTEMGFMGIEVEYFADALPENSFAYNFSIGALDPNSIVTDSLPRMIGSPSHFESIILDSIKSEYIGDDDNLYKRSVGIKTMEKTSYKIFPNPASDFVLITDLPSAETFIINLFDIQGKKLKNIDVHQNNGVLKVDISDVPNGFYLIQCKSRTGDITRKISIAR